jgi:hypothetical protein
VFSPSSPVRAFSLLSLMKRIPPLCNNTFGIEEPVPGWDPTALDRKSFPVCPPGPPVCHGQMPSQRRCPFGLRRSLVRSPSSASKGPAWRGESASPTRLILSVAWNGRCRVAPREGVRAHPTAVGGVVLHRMSERATGRSSQRQARASRRARPAVIGNDRPGSAIGAAVAGVPSSLMAAVRGPSRKRNGRPSLRFGG